MLLHGDYRAIILAGHLLLFRVLATSGTLLNCESNAKTADDQEIAVVSRHSSHKIVLYKSENLTFCESINKCSRIGYRLPVLNTQTLQEKVQSLATANISGEDVRVWLSVSRIDGWRYINESLTPCGDPCNTFGTDKIYGATFYPSSKTPVSSGAFQRPFICLHGPTEYTIYKDPNIKYWYDAQNTCIRNHNGTLPTVIDVPTTPGFPDLVYWNGLLYRPWVWVPRKETTNLEDVIHVSYTSWKNASIDGKQNDACVYADINDDGKWGVERCATRFQYYICEVEITKPQPTTSTTAHETVYNTNGNSDSFDTSTVATVNVPSTLERVISTNPLVPAVVVLTIIVVGLLGFVIGQHMYWKKRTKSAGITANSGNLEYEDTADAMTAFGNTSGPNSDHIGPYEQVSASDVSTPSNGRTATLEPVSYEQVNLREVVPPGDSPYSHLHLYERP